MTEEPTITGFVIHPAVGIARVGNSPGGYYFGPDVPGGARPTDYRDAQGRLKRKAVRFRVYGVDAQGNIVKEITAADARITWSVQVANTKAAWYDFVQALDIPASVGTNTTGGIACSRRNASIVGAARAGLAITPPAVAISGCEVNAQGEDAAYAMSGSFLGTDVYLGEARTDVAGRLVFLGGRGVSASADGAEATTFANNLLWHDDTSDGPVDATVEYQGQTFAAAGAWVVTGPPDYAPGVLGIVTGYDILFEAGAALDPSIVAAKPTFSEHIYPLLARFSLTQWVNAGFARDFGAGTPSDFADPALIARLNDPSDASRALRSTIFGWFRNPDYAHPVSAAIPAFYGDAMTTDTTSTDPREWMAVTTPQHRWLAQWAAGDFVADGVAPVPAWDALSPAEQARALDRSELDEALGGPFHPGAEFTWPMRHPSMYDAPLRIKRRSAPEPDWGTQLVSSTALAAGGPLDGSEPGSVTRWMAVPWQADTSSCLSAYVPFIDDYLPTFWPARVPNDILTEDQYAVLQDPNATASERQRAFAFAERRKWLRGIRYPDQPTFPPQIYPSQPAINLFLEEWAQVGVIVAKPGPGGAYPDPVWVETGRQIEKAHPKTLALIRIEDED